MIIELIKLFIISMATSHLVESIAEILPDNKYTLIPKYIMGCKKCASFWITLIISSNLFVASTIWVLMFLYSKFIEPKLNNTQL